MRRVLIENWHMGVGLIAMMSYVVWVCLQMAHYTHRGGALLAVFVGVAVGALAVFAGLSRR